MTHDPQQKLILAQDETRSCLGGISRGQLWKLANEGEIQRVHIGRRVFFTAASVAAYVDRLTEAATSAA